MARPKEFDRHQALGAAIAVFWRHGYEATSMDDLTKAMKISRQSLYDTFGDKHRLYLQALGRYNEESVSKALACLQSTASPLAALRDMLMLYANQTDEQRALGCLGINAISEFGQSDTAVSALGDASARRLEGALRATVSQARDKGEIDLGVDNEVAAQFLAASLAGIKISAKAGASRETLSNVVDMTINGLKPR
jgi:TetR/AcrR family transcriptional repressor of nem operon